jgi:polysaccharide biosynthesis/export protein
MGMLLAASIAFARTPAANPQRSQSRGASEYITGPGDTREVFVWRNPDLSVTAPVRPDGKISNPLVEDMPAVGRSPTQLARDIEKVLSEYVRSPEVNDATELLANVRMGHICARLAARNPRRLVVIGSAPLLAASGGRVLLPIPGQIVLVVRAGVTSQRAVLDAADGRCELSGR